MGVEEIASISQWSINFTVDEIFSLFTALIYLIIMIAIYAIVIYHFYRYVARRDCFKASNKKHSKFIGFLKYLFLFPFVAIIFFIGFSLILISLSKDVGTNIGYSVEQVLSLSFALVVAIRITAYYTEDLSRDVAKMLPFAILGVFLVDSTYFAIENVIERLNTLPSFINLIAQFIILIVLVEWILRASFNVKRYFFPPKEAKIVEE